MKIEKTIITEVKIQLTREEVQEMSRELEKIFPGETFPGKPFAINYTRYWPQLFNLRNELLKCLS